MPEQGGGGADRDPRRGVAAAGLIAAVGLCLGGGATLLLAAGRISNPSWPTAPVDVFRPLGWAGIGGVLLVAATSGRGRRAAGALLAAVGLGAAGLAAALLGSREFAAKIYVEGEQYGGSIGWEAAALLGGLALLVAGVLTATRGPGWPALGGRYDRAEPADDAWAALDRGEDPTAG